MSLDILEIVWNNIQIEARLLVDSESVLCGFMYATVLKHKSFKDALLCVLSKKLSNIEDISIVDLIKILEYIYSCNTEIVNFAARDIYAIRHNDPSVTKYFTPFLYSKGFHALQIYRIFHWLWSNYRPELAMYLYNYVSVFFNVDIHPAANIGSGVMIDHATGIIIGETSIVENDVSIMQCVTLGSTGKVLSGDRHPKIRQGVLIGAGAVILGNIEIGCGSKIGAGSVVLHSVPPCSTVTGKAAQLIKSKNI